MNNESTGKIITFYSYKGGTGRSMAVSNIACALAKKWTDNHQKILMIDWDLEAPGLHRFFEDRIEPNKHPQQKDFFEVQEGLIDLFVQIRKKIENRNVNNLESDQVNFFDNLEIEKYITSTNIPSLYLMTAGKMDESYSSRVNTFSWEKMFNDFPSLFTKFAEYLSSRYSYVLIDSRTGLTDISGVCTTLMPEKLVVVFTPNRQSLTGVINLINRATEYRKQSTDLRPLSVFPVVSRVENAEKELQEIWRFGSPRKKLEGFQPQFEACLKNTYDLPVCDLTSYFNDVQIQNVPRYSFGEEIALLSERTDDRLSITRSYENLTRKLVLTDGPWEKEKIFKRPMRVFLCHARNDKAAVRDLYSFLAANGIDAWLDEEKLVPGQDWEKEIRRAINESDAILVCLSNNSVSKRGYVQKEIKMALDVADMKMEGEIFLFPVRLEDCSVPQSLNRLQWVDLFRERGEEWLLRGLTLRASELGLVSSE